MHFLFFFALYKVAKIKPLTLYIKNIYYTLFLKRFWRNVNNVSKLAQTSPKIINSAIIN